LLGLIERERMEITDLSLVAVTDGFLAYISTLDDPPPALLAEFAGVAARLLVLKSRAMLPGARQVETEPDVDDLARQLREYQFAKQVAQSFRDIEQSGERTFARPLATDQPPPKIVLERAPVGHLRRALTRMLARVQSEPEVVPLRPVVTLGEMLNRLRVHLSRARRPARFRDLIGSQARDETVVGFIALLALWRRGEVRVEQAGLFADIHVAPIGQGAGDD
jgi:segregation and condensation protein A